MLCVKARNEGNTVLTHSVYSMIPLVEISQFIYTKKLQVKIIGGNRRQREKEGTRKWEKRVRDSVQIERVAASLINLTIILNSDIFLYLQMYLGLGILRSCASNFPVWRV